MSENKPCQTGSQCIGGKCPECEREWVGLTEEEKRHIKSTYSETAVIDAVEAKLKEKNK